MALAAVLAAVVVRMLLDPVLGDHLPFYLFYFAVIVASIRGGIGPGLTALFIGFMAAAYFFATPRFSLMVDGSEHMFSAFRFVSLGVLLVVGGSWARSVRANWKHEALSRQHKEAEVLKARQEAWSTLASIGDGVITADNAGRVTFMNAVAEQLSGWELPHATGRYIPEVFRIVHEASGDPVPDPMLRALREQRIVTLPDRTMLLARNGVERPINDSASPIRDPLGNIIGSVLVFRENTTPVVTPSGFVIGEVELYPAPGTHEELAKDESQRLERACRAWLAANWQQDTEAVRIVALNGRHVFIQQDSVEQLPSGIPGVHFRVAYER
ncbi:MAG: DUF4118 domain-containing protein [Flavobacteriales bacterium]